MCNEQAVFYDCCGRKLGVGSYVLVTHDTHYYSLLFVNLYKVSSITDTRMFLDYTGKDFKDGIVVLFGSMYTVEGWMDPHIILYCLTDIPQVNEIIEKYGSFVDYLLDKSKRDRDREPWLLSIYGFKQGNPLYLLEVGEEEHFKQVSTGTGNSYEYSNEPEMSFHLFNLSDKEKKIRDVLLHKYKVWLLSSLD